MSNRAKTYEIKPAVEFKQPFRFDFDKPNSRDFVNDEITQYFNYGFNDMTMKGYINKLRLTCKTYNKQTSRNYQENELGLTRLNDDIPFDFGGFSSFYDESLIQNKEMPSLGKGSDELMDYFIQNHTIAAKNQMPLLSFIGSMYPTNFEDDEVTGLDGLVTQIERNLEKKYQEIKIREKQIKDEQRIAANHRQETWRTRLNDRQRDTYRRGDRYRVSQSHEDSKDRRRRNKSKQRSRDRDDRRKRSESRGKKRKDSRDRSKQRSKKDKDSKKKYYRDDSRDRDSKKHKHRH